MPQVLYLPMDTDFDDDSPSGHVVINNGATIVGNQGLFVDHQSDYLSIADSDDFDFGDGDFRIEGDVTFNSKPGYGSLVRTIFSQRTDSTHLMQLYLYYYGPNMFMLVIVICGVITTTNGNTWCWFNPTIGVKYNIRIERAFDPSPGINQDHLKIYIDDVYLGGSYPNGTMVTISAPLEIGRSWYGGTSYFDGYLDNFEIYKGTQLTEHDIYLNIADAWKTGKTYLNIGDEWKTALKVYISLNGNATWESVKDMTWNDLLAETWDYQRQAWRRSI